MKLVIVFLGLIYAVTAIPSTDPNDYRLSHRIPANCNATEEDCVYFVGLNASGDNLDVYLTAMADGWAAIGFSLTRSMQASDVIGCAVQSGSDDVQPMDTYNVEEITFNELDPNNDVTAGTIAQIVEGRITCTFSRSIVGSDDPPIDYNLDEDYFLLFGFDDDAASADSGFPQHDLVGQGRPTIIGPVNPVQDVGRIEVDVPIAPEGVVIPQREPGDYRLRRRDPDDCNPVTCDYFLGIDTNNGTDEFLDFYLTANIGGWVAVGFSRSPNMFGSDVLGCNLSPLPGNPVFAVDTFNPSSRRDNNLDNNQTDIFTHNSSFENGRITCVFSRRIIGAESTVDRPLDEDYYFLFGLGGNGGGLGSFPTHGNRIPLISDGRFNPASSSGDIDISRLRQQLLQAHGILMLIAWPILAFTAIFFAAWMKQALPNGEWFQVHRAFHIAALVVAVIGFMLAFIANKNRMTKGLIELGSDNKTGTAHFVLGIIIMALQIANPIISIFRCKPNGQYRWIFNIIHGFAIGLGVEFLVYINIGLGVSIFSETQSDYGDLTILWVYLAFVIFAVVLNSGLLLFFTAEGCMKGGEGAKVAPAVLKPFFNIIYGKPDSPPPAVEMNKPGEPAKQEGPPPRKPPSPDAPIRWIALGLFLGVMIPLIVTVIIMIAATGNMD